MARETARGNTGPGRSKRHSGAGLRPPAPDGVLTPTQDSGPVPKPGLAQRPDFVRRMLGLAVVLAILALSYANTVRMYLDQQRELALVEQQIAERTSRIAELDEQLARWNDPEYVKAQARSRLGWVMPGETGYQVVDEDGQIIPDSGAAAQPGTGEAASSQAGWWDRLVKTIQNADAPTRKVTLR